MASGADKYANILTQKVVMSGANTLTFEEVSIGLSLFDKAGILLSRIEYQPAAAALLEMTASGDQIDLAITASNSISNLVATQPAVIHRSILKRMDFGTAAGAQLIIEPQVADLSTLPGGGILITPKPWFCAMVTTGLASAATGYFRFFFTVLKLTAESYFELLETRHYFG